MRGLGAREGAGAGGGEGGGAGGGGGELEGVQAGLWSVPMGQCPSLPLTWPGLWGSSYLQGCAGHSVVTLPTKPFGTKHPVVSCPRGLQTLQTPEQTVCRRPMAGPPDSRLVTVVLLLRWLGGPPGGAPPGQLGSCHLDHSTACPRLTLAPGAGHPSSAATTAPLAGLRGDDTLCCCHGKSGPPYSDLRRQQPASPSGSLVPPRPWWQPR